MAETHHNPETGTPTTRCYTVVYVSDAKYRPVPAVTLKGHWLREMGFDTGTALEVKVLPGCLILAAQEPQSEPPTEPEVVTTLKQVCKKLSERKQREIAAFIELVAAPQRRLSSGGN
ncbi:SymE family type I addiction module toxin [Erwinia mallotivora]|uniref:SymE family type I addiction module toxin n=1 Tax=Erwinia mallotivora TaxID=69222 RepID=UPI0035EC6D83